MIRWTLAAFLGLAGVLAWTQGPASAQAETAAVSAKDRLKDLRAQEKAELDAVKASSKSAQEKKEARKDIRKRYKLRRDALKAGAAGKKARSSRSAAPR